MKTRRFAKRTKIDAPASEVFNWLGRPGAFERLVPPWESVTTISRSGTAPQPGSRTVFSIKTGPFRQQWVAEHTAYEPGRMFRDEQITGPFARWVHTHTVEPAEGNSCFLSDEIEYALPFGALGGTFGGRFVQRRLERGFAYRHRIPAQDVGAHVRWSRTPLRILVSGTSGLVGRALVAYLSAGGHAVTRLVRAGRESLPPPGIPTASLSWDPYGAGFSSASALEGFDAVVHLAGENIAGGRWTAARKARIRDSRIQSTKLLAEAMARLVKPPRTLVVASAIGYYGDRGEENLVEASASGKGFLAEVCEAWEAGGEAARAAAIRVVNLRIGVVLTPVGGALKQMLPPFRIGAGGPIGDGRQWMSWIAIDDLLDVILHAIADESLSGPVNAVAPHPVTNEEWSEMLAKVLRRPAVLPMPGFAARAAFGEMADELLLASTRVLPERLLAARHFFRFAEAEPALRHLLGC